jgi:hypothetical protein
MASMQSKVQLNRTSYQGDPVHSLQITRETIRKEEQAKRHWEQSWGAGGENQPFGHTLDANVTDDELLKRNENAVSSCDFLHSSPCFARTHIAKS